LYPVAAGGAFHSRGTTKPTADWQWLVNYLQLELDVREVVRSFPSDEPMQAAITACRGLRLLRQDPWECLASFILSSTKQIVQIKQIVGLITERFGESLTAWPEQGPTHSFPSPERLAQATEVELRECKMGFRASVSAQDRPLDCGWQVDLENLRDVGVEAARAELMSLPELAERSPTVCCFLHMDIKRRFRGRLGDESVAAAYFRGRNVHPNGCIGSRQGISGRGRGMRNNICFITSDSRNMNEQKLEVMFTPADFGTRGSVICRERFVWCLMF